MHAEPALMDARIFSDEPMNIRAEMLEMPMADRLPTIRRRIFSSSISPGMNVRSEDDIARILDARLRTPGARRSQGQRHRQLRPFFHPAGTGG
jgi:hypothetical protein